MICIQTVNVMITKETKTMTEPLNNHTAKLLMYHVHKIGMDLTAFESALQGTPANTVAITNCLVELQLNIRQAQQEIIDLRDGKADA